MEHYFNSNTVVHIIELFGHSCVFDNNDSIYIAKSYLDRYLTPNFSYKIKLAYLDYFQFQIKNLKPDQQLSAEEYLAESEKLIDVISTELNSGQKYQLYIAFLEYILHTETHFNNKTKQELLRKSLSILSEKFKLNQVGIKDLEFFIRGKFNAIENKKAIVVIGDFKKLKPRSYAFKEVEHLNGNIYTYYLEQNNTFYFNYSGNTTLELNSQIIIPNRLYELSLGGLIEGDTIDSIFFNDLSLLIKNDTKETLKLSVDNISKRYPKTGLGVKSLSFQASGGELIATIGGSGTGKTTLLSLLSGTIKPDTGSVLINGNNLFHDFDILKNYIGYVPQEDLLVEELTVHQNIMYSALLSRDDLSSKEQEELVDNTLGELGLKRIRDLKIGSPTDKIISGGQRKRLNIALEMIRKPEIIYVDEPTSGLSSSDALSVIEHLKKLTYTGVIVMINIHQPSSEIFTLLDKLLVMDKFGYMAFFGSPFSAAKYFKQHLNIEDSVVEDSIRYGQYNPEKIIDLLEFRKRDTEGNFTKHRVFSSKDWNEKYIKSTEINKCTDKRELEPKQNKIPNIGKQFLYFFKRNILTRCSDMAYVLLVIIGPMLLSFVMSYFLKYTDQITKEYSFAKNDNIPVYLFISVIISIFLGLIISSGEIIKDRRILKRESFLNLSPLAYLNSKLLLLVLLNAYQSGIFILIGNHILEVRGMFFHYFIILWITGITSSSLGLILSAQLKSIISIYTVIPFIIIPFIIMSGVILDYDKMHHTLSSKRYVPFSADLTLSRWAYEAISDAQLSENQYNKNLTPLYIKQSKYAYHIRFILPMLNSSIDGLIEESADKENARRKVKILLKTLQNEFPDLSSHIDKYKASINDINNLRIFSQKVKKWLNLHYKSISKEINNTKETKRLERTMYVNTKLTEFLLKRNMTTNYLVDENEVIRKFQPAYFISKNKLGRSHYYAPFKIIGEYKIKTWKFNIGVLLLYWAVFNLLVYILLKKKYY